MSSSSPPASLLAPAPSRVNPPSQLHTHTQQQHSPSPLADARPDVRKHHQPRMHESTASAHSSSTFSSPHRPSAPDTVARPAANPPRSMGTRAPPLPISTTMHQQHPHTSQTNDLHSPSHNQHNTPNPPAFAHHHSLVTPSMPTSPLFRTKFSPGTRPEGSTGTGPGSRSSSRSGSGSGPGLGSSATGAAEGSFFSSYLHLHPHPAPQGSSGSRQSRPTSFTSSSPSSPSILSLAAGTSYTSAHVSSAFFRTMVRPDTDTTAPALFDMEGIDVSDDEQKNLEPGTRIDQQNVEGIDDTDESGASSDDETGSADGEHEREEEEEGAEEVVDIVERLTVVPGSTASILSNSVSSPSMVTARLGIFNAFKHNSSGDFFQSLGRRSEERTRQGLETHGPLMLSPQTEGFEAPVVQQLDHDFTGQQPQQQQQLQRQQQHALPNVERERVAAVDQDLQGDALLHAMPEMISGKEATVDQNPQDDSLPHTESKELHLGSVETGDRPLIETIQQAQSLIDEGVFYEAEKADKGTDISLTYSVAHHPQPEEEEENASRNELVQESRVLTDIEDSSELWKGDPLQHLESEIPMLELTLSPPIEPYRVLRQQSSVEDFVDAVSPRKTRVAENTALTSRLVRKETPGLRSLPVAKPLSRRRDMDHDSTSSGGDGGGGDQLGYELLYPRFTSLKSSLIAASSRVVSFSLLHRSGSASSASTFASAEDAGTEQLSTGTETGTGTKQVQQETSAMPSSSSSSLLSQGVSAATTTATTATLATELGHLQTSLSNLHQRLDRIEQALDVSSRRRTDLGRRTVLGVVRMVVKQGAISAVIILVVFVVLYRRRSPVAMVVMAHVQRQLRVAMGIGGAVQQGGGGWKTGARGARQSRWRTLTARLM